MDASLPLFQTQLHRPTNNNGQTHRLTRATQRPSRARTNHSITNVRHNSEAPDVGVRVRRVN